MGLPGGPRHRGRGPYTIRTRRYGPRNDGRRECQIVYDVGDLGPRSGSPDPLDVGVDTSDDDTSQEGSQGRPTRCRHVNPSVCRTSHFKEWDFRGRILSFDSS